MPEVATYMYVVGTRPNFMKTAPVLMAMAGRRPSDRHVLVHTGQHYDEQMSSIFFDQLGLPEPDHYLGVGAALPGVQTARIIEGVESLLLADRPDIIIVPGDVTSTLAAALAAAKHFVPVAHVESGLRSFDRRMPEELNRVLTDQLSELLFTHSPEAQGNLEREGIDTDRIHCVGNTMIDTLVRLLDRVESEAVIERLGLSRPYLLVTLHRPALVDGPLLAAAMRSLEAVAMEMDVVFPAHPRTQGALKRSGVGSGSVRIVPPLGYLEFLALERDAAAVLTDSGGVQEETTFLGVPCFTLRDNTERPITITEGTNVLLGLEPTRIAEIPGLLRDIDASSPSGIAGWDGRAGGRAADVLTAFLEEAETGEPRLDSGP